MLSNLDRAEVTMIENARIYTMHRGMPEAEALAWRDGRIVAVGDRQSVAERMGGAARRVDLGGMSVIPGLIDAHIHFLSYARGLARIDLDGVKSKDEALKMVAARVPEVGPGRWVLGA